MSEVAKSPLFLILIESVDDSLDEIFKEVPNVDLQYYNLFSSCFSALGGVMLKWKHPQQYSSSNTPAR
ncbi:hypothetical protein ES705_35885 [subsurface metagenome]